MGSERPAERSGPFSPMVFLEIAADDDVLDFLRRLPMVAGQGEDRITMSDLIYELQLWPFVRAAWKQVKGDPGIPGRLVQVKKVYSKAEADFERATGKQRRLKRIIDLPSFLEIYSKYGLP